MLDRSWLLLAAFAVLGMGVASANTAPLADAGLDQQVQRGATVYLDAGGSTDPDGNITAYEWSITAPDGTHLQPDCETCERTEFVPNGIGRYEVTVEVTDDDGAAREDTLYVDVEQAEPPGVEVTGPGAILAGDERTYTAEATAGDADLSTVSWRVDGAHRAHVAVDGGSATVTRDISFSAGAHNVTAIVIGSDGKRDSDTQTVTVAEEVSIDDGGGGGGSVVAPSNIEGSGSCGNCEPDGLISLTIEEEGGSKTATWEVDQELASRMKGDGATVEVADAEVHTSDLADIEEENEGERIVEMFGEDGVSERDMVKAAAAGISEKNNFQATGEGSLGIVNNERDSVEYDGWLPSKDTTNDSPDSSNDNSIDIYGSSTTADKLFSGGGTSTDDSDSWDSSGSNDSGSSSTGTGGSSTDGSSSNGSSDNDSSGGYHGGSSYTGGGGYGF